MISLIIAGMIGATLGGFVMCLMFAIKVPLPPMPQKREEYQSRADWAVEQAHMMASRPHSRNIVPFPRGQQ